MPKRAKTPTYEEDDYSYITIVQPYPMNCNWLVEADRVEFALWISCIIEKDHIIAVYHRPSSRSTAILEVIKGTERPLLGEHKWTEFLKTPDTKDIDKSSKAFYCRYKTPRQAERDGWKRIVIEDDWFLLDLDSGRRPFQPTDNGKIRFPYPQPHWCEVPNIDPTQVNLCLNLPVSQFKDRPTTQRQVPGSDDWIQTKGGSSTSQKTKSRRTAQNNSAGNIAQPKPIRSSSASMTWSHVSKSSGSYAASFVGSSSGATSVTGPPPGLKHPDNFSDRPPPSLSRSSKTLPRENSSPSSVTASLDDSVTVSEDWAAEDGDDPWEACADKSSLYANDEPDTESFYNGTDTLTYEESENSTVIDEVNEMPAVNYWTSCDDTPKTKKDEIVCPEHGAVCTKRMCKIYSDKVREMNRKENAASRGNAKGPWNVKQAEAGSQKDQNNQKNRKKKRKGRGNGNGNGNGRKDVGSTPTRSSTANDEGFKPMVSTRTRQIKNAQWESDSDETEFGTKDEY